MTAGTRGDRYYRVVSRQGQAHALAAFLAADHARIRPLSHRGIVKIVGKSALSVHPPARRRNVALPLQDPTDIFAHSNT
jgi:hypothetical protein